MMELLLDLHTLTLAAILMRSCLYSYTGIFVAKQHKLQVPSLIPRLFLKSLGMRLARNRS